MLAMVCLLLGCGTPAAAQSATHSAVSNDPSPHPVAPRYSQAQPIRHPPRTVDTTSSHYRAWERRYDPPNPLLDRDYAMWGVPPAERDRRLALVSQLATEARSTPHEFWHVRAAALAMCAKASFDRAFGWLTPDSARWGVAHDVVAGSQPSPAFILGVWALGVSVPYWTLIARRNSPRCRVRAASRSARWGHCRAVLTV